MNKEKIWNRKCNFTSSIITLNQLKMEEQIEELIRNEVPMLHIDILDGYFSPELPLGFKLVEDISKKFKDKIFLDAHVMCDPPDFFVDKLIEFEMDHINFHYETAPHVDGLLNKIKGNGIKAGVALKPSTPISQLEYVIDKCDSVMIMLFNPGYSWSKNEVQIEYTYRKVDDLYNMIQKRNLNTKIIIDGRISPENILRWGSNIVDMFVLGSTCVNKNDITSSIKKLNDIREELIKGDE